jgi:hypothetical protein
MDQSPITAAPPPAPVTAVGGNRSTWELAAMVSLLAPLAAMAISIALTNDLLWPGSRLVARIVSCTSLFLILGGLVLGIVTLFKTRRYGREYIYGKAMGGTVVSGGLILMILLAIPQVMKNMERVKEHYRQQQMQQQ